MGRLGACTPSSCVTDARGNASFAYGSNGSPGDDTIQVYFDKNGNGQIDAGEPQTTAGMRWTREGVAGTFGPGWPYGGRDFTLYYTYGGGHRYLGNVTRGATNWNNAGTHAHYAAWGGVPFAIHLSVADIYQRGDMFGFTLFANDCLSCAYTHNYVYLNQYTLDPLGDAMRTKVATHEMGHALGLRHPQDVGIRRNGGLTSVMWQGVLPYNTPQAYDTQRLADLYR
jgi:hypothetical protein